MGVLNAMNRRIASSKEKRFRFLFLLQQTADLRFLSSDKQITVIFSESLQNEIALTL